MSGLSVFVDANQRPAGERVNWQDRRVLIGTEFPIIVDPDLEDILSDDLAFERLMRDILKKDQAEEGRDGPRPNLDWDKGIQSWRELTGQDFTGLPFHQAFRVLAHSSNGKPHTIRQIANKTGVTKTRVHRLLAGTEEPDPEVIRSVAYAYGKKPQFFAEYRCQVIIDHLRTILEQNPEYSANVYRKVGLPA